MCGSGLAALDFSGESRPTSHRRFHRELYPGWGLGVDDTAMPPCHPAAQSDPRGPTVWPPGRCHIAHDVPLKLEDGIDLIRTSASSHPSTCSRIPERRHLVFVLLEAHEDLFETDGFPSVLPVLGDSGTRFLESWGGV